MAGGLYGLARHFYAYVSDDTTTYQVALTDDDAVAGGFGTAISYGSLPVFPRGWKMRLQYGVGTVGGNPVRTKTPVASPVATQWTAPSTFSKKSVTFTAEGCIGEKRTAKS
jgi:hypothetical protein